MNAADVAVIAIAVTVITVTAACRLMLQRERRRQGEHARRVIDARETVVAALRARRGTPAPDGTHEACELTSEEWGWPEYLNRRYPNLGREVTR